MSLIQPFTHAQQLYLNEVQENIRAEIEALKDEIASLRASSAESEKGHDK